MAVCNACPCATLARALARRLRDAVMFSVHWCFKCCSWFAGSIHCRLVALELQWFRLRLRLFSCVAGRLYDCLVAVLMEVHHTRLETCLYFLCVAAHGSGHAKHWGRRLREWQLRSYESCYACRVLCALYRRCKHWRPPKCCGAYVVRTAAAVLCCEPYQLRPLVASDHCMLHREVVHGFELSKCSAGQTY
jgi:hypothetical protein